jgi:hypothetical protein
MTTRSTEHLLFGRLSGGPQLQHLSGITAAKGGREGCDEAAPIRSEIIPIFKNWLLGFALAPVRRRSGVYWRLLMPHETISYQVIRAERVGR